MATAGGARRRPSTHRHPTTRPHHPPVFNSTAVGYVLNTGLDIEIPGNNSTLTGTNAADALTLTVPHSDQATEMVLALR